VVPNIKVIAEHSVCLDLLPDKARILDAGCRGMEFTHFFRDKGHSVMAIDIADLGSEQSYVRAGISTVTGKAQVTNHVDPQARHIYKPIPAGSYVHKDDDEVYVFTFKELENGEPFDLVKLDVEGEEFHVLTQAKHPMAPQVSVEFHAHCGQQTKEHLDHLLLFLSEWYTIHNQVWESRHGAGFNYWDVLLISK
jgi:hypothetical protein